MLPQRSVVVDDSYTAGTRPGCRGLVHHAILHPNVLRAGLDRLVDHRPSQLRVPKDVHDVDLLGDGPRVCVALFTQGLVLWCRLANGGRQLPKPASAFDEGRAGAPSPARVANKAG